MVPDYETASALLIAHFAAAWNISHPTDVPVAWPNVTFDPGTAFNPSSHIGWIRLTILPGDSTTVGTSGRVARQRHPGRIVIQAFTPLGTGDRVCARIADDCIAILRYQTISTIRMRGAEANTVGPDGDWYQINITARWEYDTLVPIT